MCYQISFTIDHSFLLCNELVAMRDDSGDMLKCMLQHGINIQVNIFYPCFFVFFCHACAV